MSFSLFSLYVHNLVILDALDEIHELDVYELKTKLFMIFM